MKKHIYKLLVAMFTIISMMCLIISLSACNDSGEAHKHTYGNWEIAAPTDNATGSAVKTCTTCKEGEDGHSVIVTLPVLSDTNYTRSEDTATCTEGGIAKYSITIQGDTFTFTAETSAKGHTFDTSKWEKDASGHWHAAICEHTTLTDSYAEHIDNNDDFECDVCGYPLDGSHTHSYGEWQITKPTDTEVGTAFKSCSTCEEDEEGHTVTITLPVLGNEGYTKSDDTATCEDGGEITYTISIDNETISFAIETSAKGHSFNVDFWLGDGFTHWHSSTCGHNVKGDEASCVDENGDLNCDICGYPVHQHSYEWNGNDNEHWLEPTCGDTSEIISRDSHIDVDNDDMCDTCGRLVPHTHKYSDDWSFDEKAHWHAPICTDTTVCADEAVHTFKNGSCECGAVEAEINAYKILKEKADLQESFTEWLDSLKASGVTNVATTEVGDVIYNYGNGTTEAAYVAERIVKVKAVSSGEGVAHVWVMVSLFENDAYQEINGMYALGIAETDENGIAEITFTPVGGYTSNNVDYRVRIAEKKDIAAYLGIAEETAPKPIPNRYSASGSGDNYISVEVDENTSSMFSQFSFDFSKGWNAYEQFTLPYARYYEKPYEGEDLKETGTTYEFTASGDNLFDYFYFTPSRRYSFASADSSFTPDQLAVIVENFQKAASGIYRIYFTVEGNANVTLYYWNEGGVNMGAYHITKADGTPSDDYITSISGGEAGNGKYTGGNYVEVTVTPTNGLRQYQFGIISDSAVNVTITVERIDDYAIDETIQELKVGNNGNITLLGNGTVTQFSLIDIPSGYYYLTIVTTESAARQNGLFSAYVDSKYVTGLWDGISQIKGLINIPEGTDNLYIINYFSTGDDIFKVSINLTMFEIPVLKADEEISVPISGMGLQVAGYEIPLHESVTSGTYKIDITLSGGQSLSGALFYVRLFVGNNSYSFSLPIYSNYTETVSDYISLNAGDKLSIYILQVDGDGKYTYATVFGKVKLNSTNWPLVQQNTPTNINWDSTSTLINKQYYLFKAPSAGKYRLNFTQLSYSDLFGFNDYLYALRFYIRSISEDDLLNATIGQTTASIEFALDGGETVILEFDRWMSTDLISIEFTIELINN